MQEKRIQNRIIVISLSIYLLIGIVLAIVSILDSSYVLGWLMGGAASITTFFLSVLLTDVFSKYMKSKVSGFWLGWLKSIVQLAFHGLIFLVFIMVNNYKAGYSLFGGGLSVMLKPINIYSYLAGVGIVTVSIFVVHILPTNKRR